MRQHKRQDQYYKYLWFEQFQNVSNKRYYPIIERLPLVCLQSRKSGEICTVTFCTKITSSEVTFGRQITFWVLGKTRKRSFYFRDDRDGLDQREVSALSCQPPFRAINWSGYCFWKVFLAIFKVFDMHLTWYWNIVFNYLISKILFSNIFNC